MYRTKCVYRTLLIASSFALTALNAQTAPPGDRARAEEGAAAAAPASSIWSAGPIDFSGLIDGYYSLNFNHPASGNNVIRNFDVKANQFSLNMAKLTLSHDANPVGFKLDLAFG